MEGIQPAHLSFLSIYNPSLGRTDDTIHEQVVYYYTSKLNRARKSSGTDTEQQERDDKNERLRQIGLAQGMVEFARTFSDGRSIDAIDAEKSRIVLHELEPGWWILASVQLTRIQHSAASSKSKSSPSEEPTVEYSTREVCTQDLLLQHLLRAHSIFMLHQAPTLSDLWIRLPRAKFCAALERYWNRFIRDWDVLYHGNPAIDIFNGFKLSAGGELGIGVGEEEWGSGEREVLEGFIDRTEGLTDVLVSKFGDAGSTIQNTKQDDDKQIPWIGSGSVPSSSDGVIFSGIGAVTRPSLTALSAWMEMIYKYGINAYGVSENPNAPRRKRRKKQSSPEQKSPPTQPAEDRASTTHVHPPGIPPPIVRAADKSLDSATNKADNSSEEPSEASSNTDTMLKYMTLGVYGSSWGIPSGRPSSEKRRSSLSATNQTSAQAARQRPVRNISPRPISTAPPGPNTTEGCFLTGLQGDLSVESPTTSGEDPISTDPGTDVSATTRSWNRRIQVRTLHIELATPSSPGSAPSLPTHHERLRVVLYARRPFLFCFLFAQDTPTLAYTSFYRSLHHQLGPLQRPLLRSTDPASARRRFLDELGSGGPRTLSPRAGDVDANPIFDLLWDPDLMTLHSTLPGVPEPGTMAAEGLAAASSSSSSGGNAEAAAVEWSRIDALSVHAQILAILKDTRSRPSELERTVKTSRGWWIVWMRLPPSRVAEKDKAPGQAQDTTGSSERDRADERDRSERRGEIVLKEAILVRRAGDYDGGRGKKSGWMGGGKVGSDEGKWSAGRMVEGIGVDARRYVEGLLRVGQ